MSDLNNDFEPDAVVIHRKAPHPAAHWMTGLIVVAVASLLLWTVIGQVDVVAVASGKVIPTDRSHIVQAARGGVVAALAVKDGDTVSSGQVLVELDQTELQAEYRSVQTQYRNTRNQWLVESAFGAAVAQLGTQMQRSDRIARTVLSRLLAPQDRTVAGDLQRRVSERFEAFQQQYLALRAKASSRRHALRSVEARLRHTQFDEPRARESVDAYQALYQQQLVSRERVQRAESEHMARVEGVRDLQAQQQALDEEIRQADAEAEALIRRVQTEALDAAATHHTNMASMQERLQQLQKQIDDMTVRAPIDGTVQQLAVTGAAVVIQTGMALMTIVPMDRALEIEAWIANQDIGFVDEGQRTTIKVDTYRFTRYGTVEGRVRTVSAEAVNDEIQGLRYAARIALQAAELVHEGRRFPLEPGMRVSVEIRTGRRRIIDYFLSPLKATAFQSIRER